MNPVHTISFQIFLNQAVFSGSRFAFVLYAVSAQLSPVTAGLLVALFSLAPALGSVAMGKIVDRNGTQWPSRAFTMVILIGALLPCAGNGTLPLMVAGPLIGGGFFAFYLAMSTLVNSFSDAGSRSQNFSSMSIGASLGHGLGPMIAGICIDYLDHQWAMLVLATLPLVSLVVGEKCINRHVPPSGKARSARTQAAESWTSLLLHRRLRHVYWVSVLFIVGLDVFMVTIPIYGSILQLSASQTGLLVSAFALASLVARAVAGPLSRRLAAWQILLLALACTGMGFLFLALAGSFAGLLVAALVVGLGQGMGGPMSATALYEVSPPDRQSEAMGLRLSLGMTAQTVQPILAGIGVLYFSPAHVFGFAGVLLLLATFFERSQWVRKR